MSHNLPTWTRRLDRAVSAVSRDFTRVEYRDANMADVRSRAWEFAQHQRVGQPMSAQNVEYFNCLRQRLESRVGSHAELSAAWSEAWDAANPAAG